MWNLARPDLAQVRSHLEQLTNDDGEALLEKADLDEVERLYALYEAGSGQPSAALNITTLSAVKLEDIHAAYGLTQEGRSLYSLREALILSVPLCPYCGFGEVRQLDHFVPKARFKVFSIYALNLIPNCGPCNGMRPRNPLARPANEQQLHPYLEPTAQWDFLRATILLVDGALSVEFSAVQALGMDNPTAERLRNQLSLFDLNERLIKQINVFLGTLEVSIVDNFTAGGADQLSDFLLRSGQAQARANRDGPNHWRPALLAALSESDEFCGGGFRSALGISTPV